MDYNIINIINDIFFFFKKKPVIYMTFFEKKNPIELFKYRKLFKNN